MAEFVKVGISNAPEYRMTTLMTGMPIKPVLVKTFKMRRRRASAVEALAHKLLKEHRGNGEWFKIEPATAINAIREARRMISSDPMMVIQRSEAAPPVVKKPRKPRPPRRQKGPSQEFAAEWRKTNTLRAL